MSFSAAGGAGSDGTGSAAGSGLPLCLLLKRLVGAGLGVPFWGVSGAAGPAADVVLPGLLFAAAGLALGFAFALPLACFTSSSVALATNNLYKSKNPGELTQNLIPCA